MIFKGVFIDDRVEDKVLINQFVENKNIELDFWLVVPSLDEMAKKIVDESPDFVAVDYRLDDVSQNGAGHANYKASALAQYMRDRALDNVSVDIPIVLVSAEDVLRNLYNKNLASHDLFDAIYKKDRIVKEPKIVASEIAAIARAYQTIKALMVNQDSIWSMLNLADTERYILENIQELKDWNNSSAPHQFAYNIKRSLIDKNGLLRDYSSLLALLGVDQISTEKTQITRLLDLLASEGIKYDGVFAEGWDLWWSHRLEFKLENILGQEIGQYTASERVGKINEQWKLTLKPSKSRWTGDTLFFPSFNCVCCNRPTELKHSVLTFQSNIPSFVDRDRVCWSCIIDGSDQTSPKHIEIDDREAYTVERLQDGELKRPSNS